jgi:hypothetical protein
MVSARWRFLDGPLYTVTARAHHSVVAGTVVLLAPVPASGLPGGFQRAQVEVSTSGQVCGRAPRGSASDAAVVRLTLRSRCSARWSATTSCTSWTGR